MKIVMCVTVDQDLGDLVRSTRGNQSASARLNELLRKGLLQEQDERISKQAEQFYRTEPAASRAESRRSHRRNT